MVDTLSIKELDFSTLDSGNFPGTARSFPRIQSNQNVEFLRQSSHIGSLSPSVLRIAHSRRRQASDLQRSVFSLDQGLGRLDASSNLISTDRVHVKFQADISAGVTLAEYRTAVKLLLGALLESDGALISSVYNSEV